MQLSFIAFESLGFILFIICFFHASKRGKIYITELAAAAVYGVLLEILTIIQLGAYAYGSFFFKIYNTPVAIGLGWAAIIYTAMVTADRLGVTQKVRPFIAALLALNIDLSMDAIAIREGFWNWGVVEPRVWFGVPLGNFFAWFVVTFSFSYFIYRFRKNQKLRKIYPLLAVVLSIIILLILDDIWHFTLTQSLRTLILFGMLFVSIVYVLINKGSLKTDNGLDWKILLTPFAIHLFFLTLLLTGEYYMSVLAFISFSMLIVGLYVHLLPSSDILRKCLNLSVGGKKIKQ